MTPTVRLLLKQGIKHRTHAYTHDPEHPSFGLEASEKLGVASTRVFKTLIVAMGSGSFCVAIIPTSATLNLKRAAQCAQVKKVSMAARADAERVTGYTLGGISPLGQKRALPTMIDQSALDFTTIYVSAGRRGLEIEISPRDLQSLTNATYAQLTNHLNYGTD